MKNDHQLCAKPLPSFGKNHKKSGYVFRDVLRFSIKTLIYWYNQISIQGFISHDGKGVST